MCHRVICNDCGCGLHIAQALSGLSLEEICSCDDDQDSEHSWSTVISSSTKRAIPKYPIPYTSSSKPAVCLASGVPDEEHSEACVDPSPVEYKLSKISATSATEAAIRKAKQAAALEELKRQKEEKEKELKDANQDTLNKLLKGLSQDKDTATE
ncbi:hypothetical protein BGZ65_007708, partial [Modicella reniformis]